MHLADTFLLAPRCNHTATHMSSQMWRYHRMWPVPPAGVRGSWGVERSWMEFRAAQQPYTCIRRWCTFMRSCRWSLFSTDMICVHMCWSCGGKSTVILCVCVFRRSVSVSRSGLQNCASVSVSCSGERTHSCSTSATFTNSEERRRRSYSRWHQQLIYIITEFPTIQCAQTQLTNRNDPRWFFFS